MPPEVLEYLGVWTAITSSCIVVLVGMKIFLNHRRDILIDRNSSEETRALVDDVLVLREEVTFLRAGLEEVTERLEFHERLLTKAAEEPIETPV
jgi:hypothetical protein